MSLRMLQISDVHLGAPLAWLGDRAAARRDEIAATFRGAVEYALDPRHGIACVVIAGDLFDSRRPDHDSVALVRGLLMRLAANGRTVVILPGFHDGLGLGDSVYRSERLPGIDVFGPGAGEVVTHDIGGTTVHFHGVCWMPGQSAPQFEGFHRGDAAGIHVGVLHAALAGHAETGQRPAGWSVTTDALRQSGLDYIALGGPHGATELRGDGFVAAASGSPEGLEFREGEMGRKGWLVVDVGDGEVRTETVPASRRTLVDLRIDLAREGIRDGESLRDALLARSGADVFARVTLVGTREFLCDHDALATSLESQFGWLAIIDAASFEQSLLLRRIGSENTIRGFFVRRMQRRLDGVRERLRARPDDAALLRELSVSNTALTLGLEQFLDEDAVVRAPRERPAGEPGAPARVGASIGGGGGPATARPPVIENEDDVADDREVELEEES